MKEEINSPSRIGSDEQIKSAGPFLSSSAWLLIAGGVLFGFGCFLPSKTLSEIVHFLDLRLWPIWYFPLALLLAVFVFFWIRFYCNWEDYSDDQQTTARRFIRLSVFCTIVIVASFVIYIGEWYLPLRTPLYFLFVTGSFSLPAVSTVLIVLGVLGTIVWLLKEWISSMGS